MSVLTELNMIMQIKIIKKKMKGIWKLIYLFHKCCGMSTHFRKKGRV